MQSGSLSITQLIFDASPLVQAVMLFLLILSVASWTIIIARSNLYKNARIKADEFEDRFWSGIDLNNLYQDCVKRQSSLIGLEVIYTAGFKEFVRLLNSGPAEQEVVMDGTYRQMKVSQSREMENLEANLATLATIGSISPYIGLFGTVWGIMHAFIALAAVKNATLSMVAPAVMFYNRFASKVEALENRYINFMDEFSTILNRRLVRVRSEMNAKDNMPSQTQAQSSQSYQPSTASASSSSPFSKAPEERVSPFGSSRLNRVPNATEDRVHYQTPGIEGDRERNLSRLNSHNLSNKE